MKGTKKKPPAVTSRRVSQLGNKKAMPDPTLICIHPLRMVGEAIADCLRSRVPSAMRITYAKNIQDLFQDHNSYRHQPNVILIMLDPKDHLRGADCEAVRALFPYARVICVGPHGSQSQTTDCQKPQRGFPVEYMSEEMALNEFSRRVRNVVKTRQRRLQRKMVGAVYGHKKFRSSLPKSS